MSHREDIMLWLDLETTGSGQDESIIEVGILATDQTVDLNPLGEFQSLVMPDSAVWKRMNDFNMRWSYKTVVEMHTANGLLKEVRDGMFGVSGSELLPSVEMVEGAILYWLKSVAGPSTQHIPLAGSGVSHFDRQFIRRDWPRFDKRLTYWAYDVGVVRRMRRLAGLDTVDNTNVLTHRALDDAKDHAEEARNYLREMRDAA